MGMVEGTRKSLIALVAAASQEGSSVRFIRPSGDVNVSSNWRHRTEVVLRSTGGSTMIIMCLVGPVKSTNPATREKDFATCTPSLRTHMAIDDSL